MGSVHMHVRLFRHVDFVRVYAGDLKSAAMGALIVQCTINAHHHEHSANTDGFLFFTLPHRHAALGAALRV